MKLEFIALGNLAVSKSNMRYARKAPDVSDILPTVRARGVIQPILVRPNCQGDGEPGHFEIVAGCRRFHAAQIVAAERQAARAEAGEPDPDTAMLPCAVLDDTDDASAVEASLIENVARLDPDEVSRWACFTRLVKEGRTIEDIAQTFGLPDLAVKRILALGNLLPRIREMYRAEEIDAATIRHLTLASKSQQKAWLALADDPASYAPRGYQLKSWLFGGQSVPVGHALFDAEASGLATVADLFGEDAYFAETDAFWDLQNAAIEVKRASFLEAGWADAVVLGPETHFHSWEHEKTAKRKGGRVYLDVRANGEVVIHEGYLSRKEAARMAKAGGADGGASGTGTGTGTGMGKADRPELTSVTQTYIDLHRHAAVRAAMLERPGIALRLMIAHAIAGSPLWRIVPESQTAKNDAVKASVDECPAEAVFDERRRAVLALLDLPDDDPTVIGGSGYSVRGSHRDLCRLFARLIELPDTAVMEVLTLVMGEALEAGSAAVEALGTEIGMSMSDWWEADEALLETLRDREVLLAMVGEVAGSLVASANAGEKAKTLRGIIRDHLAGAGGRPKREGWIPRWMTFPPAAYTTRGGVGTVEAHARVAASMTGEGGHDECADGPDPDTALPAIGPVIGPVGAVIDPVIGPETEPETGPDAGSEPDTGFGSGFGEGTEPDAMPSAG
ncbi:ParB family chromosome partitioning protein [Novosphingobium sp. PhB165]|uniref:ParB/RepB/Spo0J family partition protein n=1 Tax=Novosphingobium sp. PhB165 TaxID=2485105 RepID=UPI001053272F|nr:ParB N-terminal domain-containing protein [Novosphingobium sp. PhB165]TCM12992.1 ParB family chromosome partitioning protein [Novosphingobium sp. PhB165]